MGEREGRREGEGWCEDCLNRLDSPKSTFRRIFEFETRGTEHEKGLPDIQTSLSTLWSLASSFRMHIRFMRLVAAVKINCDMNDCDYEL